MLDGALKGFERILGAAFRLFDFRKVALDRLARCGFRLDPGVAFAVAAAHLLDMHEQIGEPALDPSSWPRRESEASSRLTSMAMRSSRWASAA